MTWMTRCLPCIDDDHDRCRGTRDAGRMCDCWCQGLDDDWDEGDDEYWWPGYDMYA